MTHKSRQKLKILVVEDEIAIRTGLIDVLIYHGYQVEFADEGHQALKMALSGQFDLVLLDVMLPGMDGFSICEQLRIEDKELPIIMLTAKSTDEDVITGLKLGADDYVSKPFSIAQLVLRIQAVLRRTQSVHRSERFIQLGDKLKIDALNLSAHRGQVRINFTRKEMDLLLYLKSNQERPISRDELLNKVWGYNKAMEIETRTVDIHIAKLRRKLETNPKDPKYLITVRGAGYRLLDSTVE